MGERNCPPLLRAHGGEAEVSLVGDVRKLGQHKSVVTLVYINASRLALLPLLAILRILRIMPPLLAIPALDAVFSKMSFNAAFITSDIPGGALTEPLGPASMVRATTTPAGATSPLEQLLL